MDKDKKPALLLGLSFGKKGKPMDDEDDADDKAPETERDHDAAFREAADNLLDAIESGDKEAFREALQAAIYACQE